MGAETEMIHLYELAYSDCKSCFACKRKGNQTNGICAIQDELRPVLERLHEANVIVMGTPIYFSNMTGQAVSFINRLMFPVRHYQQDGTEDELLPIKKKCAMIVTMNVTEAQCKEFGYSTIFESTNNFMDTRLGSSEILYVYDTLQFTNYDNYYAGYFDGDHKKKHHDEHFPDDLKKAYELGKKLVENSK